MKPETIKYALMGLTFILAGVLAFIANRIGNKNNFRHERPANGPVPPGNTIIVREVGGIKQGSEVLIGGQWVKVNRRVGNKLWVKPAEKMATRG